MTTDISTLILTVLFISVSLGLAVIAAIVLLYFFGNAVLICLGFQRPDNNLDAAKALIREDRSLDYPVAPYLIDPVKQELFEELDRKFENEIQRQAAKARAGDIIAYHEWQDLIKFRQVTLVEFFDSSRFPVLTLRTYNRIRREVNKEFELTHYDLKKYKEFRERETHKALLNELRNRVMVALRPQIVRWWPTLTLELNGANYR